MEYTVKTDVFEGPFDLLYHLIEKNEIDICQVSLVKIADEYISYIETWQTFSIEIASEFLWIAASLLHLKAKILLAEPDSEAEIEEEFEEILSEEELVERLLEYRKFKSIAEYLQDMRDEQGMLYTKDGEIWEFVAAEDDEAVPDIGDISLNDLLQAFANLFNRIDEPKIKIKTGGFKTIREKMHEVIAVLRKMGGKAAFIEFFETPLCKNEIIVTLLALLEMAKQRRIRIEQKKLCDDITVVLSNA